MLDPEEPKTMTDYTITIDGGTTNTRVYLLNKDGKIIYKEKSEIGVRNTAIDGNNHRLKETVRDMIVRAAESTGDKGFYENLTILASGMLTSNVGLYELPHITAPAVKEDFANNAESADLPDVCGVPIVFIPGLKNYNSDDITLSNLQTMDMMRGEEVQTIALLENIESGKGMVLILPGSHTKVVIVGKNYEIKGCLTCMTGEMLQIMTQFSILADAVDGFVKGEPDKDYLKAGFISSKNSGSLSRAGFLTRICSTFVTKDKEQLRSFLLGAVLEQDIAAIENSEMMKNNTPGSIPVRIVGKEPLASAIGFLMKEFTEFTDVEVANEDPEMPLSVKGTLLISKCIRR